MFAVTKQERKFFEMMTPHALRPDRGQALREAAVLARRVRRDSIGSAYPGNLRWPRTMDGQFLLEGTSGQRFRVNVELQRGSTAYTEQKRSRMLDPHLLEACRQHYGKNFLNVMVVKDPPAEGTQRYEQLARYLTPDVNTKLWVILCPKGSTEEEAAKFAGRKIRELIRRVIGLK